MFNKDTAWLVGASIVALAVLYFAAKTILGFIADHPFVTVLISVLAAAGSAVYFALNNKGPGR